MSTKSSIFYHEPDKEDNSGRKVGNHKLCVHVYRDMHQVDGTVVVELECNTCYCSYQFLMDEHLGLQLSELIKKGLESETNDRSNK